jgi:hypothetical protein
MIALRLVIDTNVVVSAAIKPDGLQRTVVLLALTKPAPRSTRQFWRALNSEFAGACANNCFN